MEVYLAQKEKNGQSAKLTHVRRISYLEKVEHHFLAFDLKVDNKQNFEIQTWEKISQLQIEKKVKAAIWKTGRLA